MAQVPTVCEVSYDSPWLGDEHFFYTPFRLPSANRSHSGKIASYVYPRSGIGHGDDRQNGFGVLKSGDFLQQDTYFEYLRDYYIENSSAPITYGGTVASPQLPPRPYSTVPAIFPGNGSIVPVYFDYNQTSHPISLPALSRLQYRDDSPEPPPSDEKLVWIDTLNAWVSEKKYAQGKPYLSFVNNPLYVEKLFTATEVLERRKRIKSESPDKRAQRKAYSTPLYNHNVSRKVRFTPLSAQAAYTSRNPPSPSSIEDIHEIDIRDTGGDNVVHVPDEKEDVLADKITEVFGKDTHSSEIEGPLLPARKEPKPPLKRPQKTPVQEKKVEQKPSLPKIEKKEEIIVIAPPPPAPKKPEKAKEKATKVINPKPTTPKPKQKLWTALPKFELKSPKPSKKTSGLLKKKKETISKPQPLPVSSPEPKPQTPPLLPRSPPKSPASKSTDTQTDRADTESPIHDITPVVSSSTEIKDDEKSKRVRSPIKKKDRVVRNRSEQAEELPDGPELLAHKQSSWIYGKDDDYETDDTPSSTVGPLKFDPAALPTAPDVPDLPKEGKRRSSLKSHVVNKHLMPVDTSKKRWGTRKVDNSYEDEQRRAELAELRRKRQMEMYQRLKLRKPLGSSTEEENGTNGATFDDYDFLSKYCIFSKNQRDMYQHTFNTVDENLTGWIDCADTMVALRTVNNKLTDTEEEYLYRVMEMTGYKISHGADFKLFSILAALSTKISLLDSWMKNIIGDMDFKTLEMKLFLCKTLWECNVNRETNTISLEQVMIELRVGGVSYKHECQVRKKLGHLKALDLFDFLTYVPLFIMIHESVVDNPLDDSRNK